MQIATSRRERKSPFPTTATGRVSHWKNEEKRYLTAICSRASAPCARSRKNSSPSRYRIANTLSHRSFMLTSIEFLTIYHKHTVITNIRTTTELLFLCELGSFIIDCNTRINECIKMHKKPI